LLRFVLNGLLVALLVLKVSGNVLNAQVPSGFSNAQIMNGFQEPVGFTFDANGRWYVWEKRGKVWIVENGVRRSQPLIDISGEVGNWRDHGCLGFALDPNFLINGRIYLMYTVDRHHLMNFGTGNYNANTDQYFAATIMRISRYTATGPNFNSVDPASRYILLGETPQTGAPMLHESHSTGQLVFGTDGTLLAGMGDAADYGVVDIGNGPSTYYAQALLDGIITPAENIGAMRSQMVNCLNGKILRLDPNTGDGIPSNPFYDALEPRAPRSRVWALGLRNPYRMKLRPGTGSTDPAQSDPGVLYIGDVGMAGWEELNVCTEGGENFGWPLFEGMEANVGYMSAPVPNLDAPNPRFGQDGCTQQYFNYQDLLVQDSPIHLNAHPNPCDAGLQVPVNIPTFFHHRPEIDWQHVNRSRSGGFDGNTAVTFDLDAPGAPVTGPRFGGNASLGGTWIRGIGWPIGYQDVYMHGDYGQGWVKRFNFNDVDEPVSVANFASTLGGIVHMEEGPDGALWYVRYEANAIWKISPIGVTNLPPIAMADQSVQYGPGPLTVSFSAAGSSDPENGALTYSWNFGDGNTGSGYSVQHTFTAPPGVPTSYTVTLTATDPQGAQNTRTLLVSVNNTPPVVAITSFPNGHLYPPGVDTTYALQASVSDAEHPAGQLTYSWRTILHHNNHVHPEAESTTATGSTIISGVGCYGEDFSFEVVLTVTDGGGLSTTVTNWLFPRCAAIAPTAVISASASFGVGPLSVQLNGTGSVDNGTISGYFWDFGDGTTSTGPQITKVFTAVGEYQVTLTITDNDGLTGQVTKVITVLNSLPPQCVGAAGSLLRQYWNSVPGSSVSSLISSPNYPNTPTGTNYISTFQGPSAFGNTYGTRVRGYILAPTTGNYVFTLTSDDDAVVYFSANADPLYKLAICSVSGFTEPTEFNKFASQTSASVPLVAGRYYYIELLHKEGSGSDHFAVWWQTPANSTRTIIPSTALVAWQDCMPSVELRAYLKGPFNLSNNLMSDNLRAASLLPGTEPFTALGFTQTGGGGGETVSAATLAVTGKNAVVDWVLVELRDKNTPATIVATRSALLQRDGDIVGTDGYQRLLFNLPVDNYYVAVRHRNHLGVMTAGSVALGTLVADIDFTRTSTATHGSNARALLNSGRMALWSGNVVRDALLKYTGQSNDRDPLLLQVGSSMPTNMVGGYFLSDVNLDGVVKYTGMNNDRDPIIVNLGGNTPNATRTEQLP
jgi:glucose/arabinose dehydrogenase/chitodextrinase